MSRIALKNKVIKYEFENNFFLSGRLLVLSAIRRNSDGHIQNKYRTQWLLELNLQEFLFAIKCTSLIQCKRLQQYLMDALYEKRLFSLLKLPII